MLPWVTWPQCPVAVSGELHISTMNFQRFLLISLTAAFLPLMSIARSPSPESLLADTAYGQPAGTREVTLSGGGASNKELDSSFGTVDFSYGTYVTTRSLWVIRQSLGYSNPDNAENGWSGATRFAYDYHLIPDTKARPFLGISAGRVYGDTVNDSWTAGLEGGAKIFVKPQTFVFAVASYDWFFDRGADIDNQFSTGRFGWSLGLGYQF